MIEIEQYIYGMTDDGEAIILYKMLFENGCQAEVCNLGATVLSAKSAEGKATKESVQLAGIESPAAKLRSKIWESRVEVNRVVMTTIDESDTLQVEAVFDLDEECNLEVSYRAMSSRPVALSVATEEGYDLATIEEPALNAVALEAEELFAHHILYRFTNN